MQMRSFGRTGIAISEIGHGTWGMGGHWGPRQDETAIAALLRSFELGVTFVDTAWMYGDGHSERLVADAGRRFGKRPFIATKVPPKNFQWPARPSVPVEDAFPSQHIIDYTERSLTNLGVDCIDLQQLHVWVDEWFADLSWLEAIDRLKRAGKIRFFGVSINSHQPESAMKLVKLGRWWVTSLFLTACFVSSAGWASNAVTITILHTNNIHGHLEPDQDGRGGLANVAGTIDAIKKEVGPHHVLLLDAGSAMQGTPISNLVQGASTIAVMNRMGYQAMTLGNHDFDWGMDVLCARAKEATFPFLAANVVRKETHELPTCLKPTTIIDVAGLKIGVIGITSRETPLLTASLAVAGLEFKDEYQTLVTYYDELKNKTDGVVVVFHSSWETTPGYWGIKKLAQKMTRSGRPVDLIIGARQVKIDHPDQEGATRHVVAWRYGQALGRADVVVDPAIKRMTLRAWRRYDIRAGANTANATIAREIARWAEKVRPLLHQVIGVTQGNLTREGFDSSWGNLICDSLRDETRTDLCLTNAGGIRSDIFLHRGERRHSITWEETFLTMPFGNTVVTMDLSGAQIMTLLRASCSMQKGLLQISGGRYACSEHGKLYRTIIADKPLRSAGRYHVVTNSFLATGGDGFSIFRHGKKSSDTHRDMREAVNDYIRTHSPISVPRNERIFFERVDKPAEIR